MFEVNICPLSCGANNLARELSIFGMSSLKDQLQRRLKCSIIFEDIVGFFLPVNLSA